MNKAQFFRKALDINDLVEKSQNADNTATYIVEKVITLDKTAFKDFASDFFAFKEIITENNELMRIDENGVWHVIQIECSEVPYSILVECEGYDYARYTAVVFKKDLPLVCFDSNGETGNVFCLVALAKRKLTQVGRKEDCDKLWSRVQSSLSYENALEIMREYVNLFNMGGAY